MFRDPLLHITSHVLLFFFISFTDISIFHRIFTKRAVVYSYSRKAQLQNDSHFVCIAYLPNPQGHLTSTHFFHPTFDAQPIFCVYVHTVFSILRHPFSFFNSLHLFLAIPYTFLSILTIFLHFVLVLSSEFLCNSHESTLRPYSQCSARARKKD